MARGKVHKKLNQFYATAISGNDILSSALYVSGIAAIFAGIYAPLVLLMVVGVLFFYRSVYREVVEALPVNGGAYNALLNGTSKTFAALAGVMTVLSYIATAVISAKTGVEYLFTFIKNIAPDFGFSLPFLDQLILPIVILILLFFAVLVVFGVRDSAKVAATIFCIHIGTLVAFLLLGALVWITKGGSVWQQNFIATNDVFIQNGGLLKTLFLGFSASLLGVSGFESSANFVEEQAPHVFRKTLRNMTIGVLVFNPLIAAIVLHVLPLGVIHTAKDFLLAEAAFRMGGPIFLGVVSIDALLVLSGAVLTSFIGVTGLVNRMALDDTLPAFLLKENKYKSHPRIIFAFFFLCVSILVLTRGELLSLAGVYTVSFLSVMTLFATANLILRKTRTDLKRPYVAPIFFVLIALFSTFVGLLGNISIDIRNVGYFLTYFVPASFLVLSVIYKKDVYTMFAKITTFLPPVHEWFERRIHHATNYHVYVFVHHVERLFEILKYIKTNESATNITLIHCEHGHNKRSERLREILTALKEAGFFPQYNVEVVYLKEKFGPDVVASFAKRRDVKPNKIFIGSIHHYHRFKYQDLGGVRIIN